MENLNKNDAIKSSINQLLHAAEIAAEEARAASETSGEGADSPNPVADALKLSDEDVAKHLEGLDLLITEEATLALRAEFLRFSSVFDTNSTRETIHNAVTEVTKPLLEAWINRHMADIAKSVIKEAIGKIADVRRPL